MVADTETAPGCEGPASGGDAASVLSNSQRRMDGVEGE